MEKNTTILSDPSLKDDMESIGYILLYLCTQGKMY